MKEENPLLKVVGRAGALKVGVGNPDSE